MYKIKDLLLEFDFTIGYFLLAWYFGLKSKTHLHQSHPFLQHFASAFLNIPYDRFESKNSTEPQCITKSHVRTFASHWLGVSEEGHICPNTNKALLCWSRSDLASCEGMLIDAVKYAKSTRLWELFSSNLLSTPCSQGRIDVRLRFHHKQTAPECFCECAETTSSKGSRCGCFGPRPSMTAAFRSAKVASKGKTIKDCNWKKTAFTFPVHSGHRLFPAVTAAVTATTYTSITTAATSRLCCNYYYY